jgi:uncharacterized protein YjbI with pentapeptide repeats
MEINRTGLVQVRRIDIVLVTLLGLLMVSAAALAQVDPGNEGNPGDPKSNVNVVGMTPDPADIPDTYYRQQNEPACAIRPGDSACIICAYNDYRGVDFPVGDSWQGVSQSCDAGATWRSRLAPGHPGDQGVELIPAEFAADPRLVAVPGMAIFNFIAGFRDSNVGVLGIQHWLEVTKEDADHWEPARTTWFADTGTSGRFLDKPDILFLMDPKGQQGTIRLTTEMENTSLSEHPDPGQAVPGFITRDFPTGTLYAAYAVFTGSNSIKVLVKTSEDLGRTWKNRVLKLSEDQNEVSGISLTAIGDNKVLAVWRRKGDNNDPDSILYSIISNGGKKATKGEVLADICAFDQPTLTGTEILELVQFKLAAFRTNDFPWAANDGENLFVFYSDRGRDDVTGACLENEPPRIVMHYSTDSGQSWNAEPIPVDTTTDSAGSFQFMPAAFGANGKVQVAYYDTRNEVPLPLEVPLVADYESGGTLVQRTVDVYTTNVTLKPSTGQNEPVLDIPDPVRVSQFSIVVNNETGERFESEASFANSKLFAQGKAPFLGDYIAIAARGFREITSGPNEGKWESNASSFGGNEDFFAAWTSNRDVFGAIPGIGDPSGYTKPANAVADNRPGEDSADEMTEKPMLANSRPIPETGPPRDNAMVSEGLDGSDPSAVPAVCSPGVPTPVTNERSRDSNIYGSLIKDQVRLYAPTPSKPLGGVVRAFVVALSNSDVVPQTYDLEIVPGNCNAAFCKASFRQQPSKPPFGADVPTETGITVPPKSTLARTVFVAGDQDPVRVIASEGGNPVATIQLANAPSFRDPENCEDSSCTVATSELHNLELQTIDPIFLASLVDPDQLNANLLNSPPLVQWAIDAGCCDGEDPPTLGSVIDYAVENIGDVVGDIEMGTDNAALLNAALLNANLLNANLLNANLLNANLLNANLLNASPGDLGVLDPDLVAATTDCCGATPTIGDIIVYAFDPANGINAALLNAALLNVNLLNANLLNANLLNANLLNANLLNANLLNAALLNLGVEAAALLNAGVEAGEVLATGLLNADLLNANLLNPTLVDLAIDGDCCGVSAYDPLNPPRIADVLVYAVGHPETINAALLNASLLNANLLNANLLNANLLNANLLNANLLNANLVDASGTNDSLLNADLINADFVNANLLNTSLVDPEDVVTFDDYNYPLTNNGNVTTAIDVDITINAPTNENGELDIVGAKLMTWTANATPTVVDCVERVQLDTRLQSISGIDGNFEVADISNPFAGQVSAVVAAGETVVATLRVSGTRDQLKNVRVNAFTASSQAANCFPDPDNAGNFICDDELTQGDEQILFEDTDPPIITVPDDITVDATGPGGAIVDYAVTVTDNADADPLLECLPESGSFFDIGTTLVTCNATDAAGNQADSANFNVTVLDTTAPVITLNGDATVTLEAGVEDYTEAGASVADDGDPSVTVVIGGDTVDADTVGTYTVTYDASDASGNVAAQVIRTVIVEDTTAPMITLIGVATVTLEAGVGVYTESGASVSDVGDPTLLDATVGGDTVDPNEVGIYVVTYNATDASGNDAIQVTRTVNVVDTIAPVITLNGDASVTLEAGLDGYTELGATVSDAGDPTLVDVTVGGDTVDPNEVGTYVVTYDATDASGNAALQVIRTVTVEDTIAPIITVNDDDGIIEFAANDPQGAYVDLSGDPNAIPPIPPIVTASDQGQEIPVSCVTSTGTALPAWLLPGDYVVICTASDGFTVEVTVSISVDIDDDEAPVLTIPLPSVPGEPAITVDADPIAGTAVVDYSAQVSATDNVDQDVTIVCDPPSSSTFSAGITTVTCTASDDGPNASGDPNETVGTFIVEVADVTAPIITVPGDPVFVGALTSPTIVDYADQVIVFDAVYPDTEAVCEPASGSEFDFGDTLVTCNAVDLSGNAADEVSFTITVGFPYDIYLQPPKKTARAGSTVPLDWKYLDRNTGQTIDSSAFIVEIRWAKMTDNSCTVRDLSMPEGSSGPGDDSGNSDFRYSQSSDTWQYSWQTPDVPGYHKVSVNPPGGNVDDAWACIRLR